MSNLIGMSSNPATSGQQTLYCKNPYRANSKHFGCPLIKFFRDINCEMNYRFARAMPLSADPPFPRGNGVFPTGGRQEGGETCTAAIIYSLPLPLLLFITTASYRASFSSSLQ